MMSPPFCLRRHRTKAVAGIYNADQLTEAQVAELLAEDAALLFKDKELISETSNGRSFCVHAFDRDFFLKEFKPRKWYRRGWEFFFPACHNNFHAGVRLLRRQVPTPAPLISAVVQGRKRTRQLLVTEFCRDAVGLDEAMATYKNNRRARLSDEVAALLADFHCKGFYSRHLRSANILVREQGRGWDFWFVDLDRLGSNRLLNGNVFINTVSRASFEFFEQIKPDERQYLLRACFDAALKQNIFRKPSQQQWFVKQAVQQIGKRA